MSTVRPRLDLRSFLRRPLPVLTVGSIFVLTGCFLEPLHSAPEVVQADPDLPTAITDGEAGTYSVGEVQMTETGLRVENALVIPGPGGAPSVPDGGGISGGTPGAGSGDMPSGSTPVPAAPAPSAPAPGGVWAGETPAGNAGASVRDAGREVTADVGMGAGIGAGTGSGLYAGIGAGTGLVAQAGRITVTPTTPNLGR
ncbi:hypothetical protein [Telmatospirillum sp. J64-1]|uniref:hypothetical protein n=1 Tax=Telmatospirillum sp. J64-1 TaxID=2502183 RepID=UPI00115F3122|nr:hypothetical protein [Telmatospirillum sp. J64-1]